MIEKLPLWEAAKRELEEYQFIAGAELQPKWDVSEKVAINAAVSAAHHADPFFGRGQMGVAV